MRFLYALFALLLAPAVAAQDGGTWVSLGSYGSPEAAERARGAASEQLSDPVGVASVETGAGVRYRVVAGPFPNRRAAVERMPELQASGYADAWIIQSALVAVPAGLEATAVASVTEAALPAGDADLLALDDYDLADFDLDGELPITDLLGLEELDLPELDLGDLPGLTAPVERDPAIKPTEEPAFEAPPQYQLHKLKRGT